MRGARLLLLGACLLVSACAGGAPVREAAGTPAADVAARSFVAVRDADGALIGSGVAVGPRHLLTNLHVVEQAAGDAVRLVRGDGGREGAGRVVARSPRMDLAVVEVAEGFAEPAPLAGEGTRQGQAVWALGPPGLGRAVAAGQVLRPRARLAGHGTGFIARAGALMGFSGGPVVGADGRVAGLTTALPDGDRAEVLALLAGVDLDGLLRGAAREVFVLGIAEAMTEARRLVPGIER